MKSVYKILAALALVSCTKEVAKHIPTPEEMLGAIDTTVVTPTPPDPGQEPDKPDPTPEPVDPRYVPKAELSSDIVCAAASISFKYSFSNTKNQKEMKHGLCWNTDGAPTVDDARQYGPQRLVDGMQILQSVPGVLLDPSKTYHFRVFMESEYGTFYSEEVSASLAAAPEPLTFGWTEITPSGFPGSLKVYRTKDKMNGRNFNAWYAIGDLSAGDIELKINLPSSVATIDDQAAADKKCLVLTNGGYFYNGRHTGVAAVAGNLTGNVASVRGSLRSDETEYNVMYSVTRGAFGVDASGKPNVLWAGTDNAGGNHFFDRPLPSVKGEAKYEAISSTNPNPEISWKPQYAVSAGPVLLKNGNYALDLTENPNRTGNEYYLSNFEIIPYDIYSSTLKPDRTAVGYTADGKVVLFICDGRYAASDGAYIDELARIMKGLGCVDAVNLDGGGSTGMMVGGSHVNDITTGGNRAVVTTIGFYRK